MEQIIEKLYELHLNTDSHPYGFLDKENTSKEWKLYEYLYTNLSKEYKNAFMQYANLRENRRAEELKAAYEYGFKTAITLIVESLKD